MLSHAAQRRCFYRTALLSSALKAVKPTGKNVILALNQLSHGAEIMFVQQMAKTEMTHFWQFMFNLCNEEYSCVLGWGMGGVIAFLVLLMGVGTLIARANKRRE